MPAILTREANMSSVTLSPDLAIQFPPEARTELNLRPGQAYAVIPRGKSLLLVPVPTLEELCGIAEGAATEGYRDRQGSSFGAMQ